MQHLATNVRRSCEADFLGKDSTPDDSPTLYATDQDSYVIQGWIVTDPTILARLTVADEETIVEIPASLLDHLVLDGLGGTVANFVAPIVCVTDNGNYIIQGERITDAETLSQMNIPNHETCVHVTKSAIRALLAGV